MRQSPCSWAAINNRKDIMKYLIGNYNACCFIVNWVKCDLMFITSQIKAPL